jgi:hypothetical protein
MPFKPETYEGKPGWVCTNCKTLYITNKDLTNRICPCQVDPSMREIVLGMLTGTRQNVYNAYQRYKKLPPLPQMALNYAKAQSKWVINGSRWATKEQAIQRVSICLECPSDLQTKDSKGHLRCTHFSCGCYLATLESEPEEKTLKIIEIGKSDCPKNHWPIIG